MPKKKIKFDKLTAKVHQKHWGQTRKRKDNLAIPYILHPLDVVRMLHSWSIGDKKFQYVWNAALCHDVEEDAEGSQIEWLKENIGDNATEVVIELTYYPEKNSKEDYLKTFVDSSVEALVIKLADRICNVSDIMVFDHKKAAQVFLKAKELWAAFYVRTREIEEFFGKETLSLITNNVLTFNGIFGNESTGPKIQKAIMEAAEADKKAVTKTKESEDEQ